MSYIKRLIKIKSLLVSSCFLFFITSQAQASAMLSYTSLMKLSKEKRISYLRKVSKALSYIQEPENFNKVSKNTALFNINTPLHLLFLSLKAQAEEKEYRCVGGGVPVKVVDAFKGRETDQNCGTNSYAGFTCSNENHEICNPILFGLDSQGRAICYRNATTALCYKNTKPGVRGIFPDIEEEDYNAFVSEIDKLCPENGGEPSVVVYERTRTRQEACVLVKKQKNINLRRRSGSNNSHAEQASASGLSSEALQASAVNTSSSCQTPEKPANRHFSSGQQQEFFEYYAPLAQYIERETGFPASITLSKAALETAYGSSSLARSKNNFAGMSCFSQPTGWSQNSLPAFTNISIESRCGNGSRGENGREGGAYREYKHGWDSIYESINLVLTRDFYHENSLRKYGLSIPNTVQEIKESGYTTQRRDDILTVLDRVYAPDQRDCSSCPASNNNYDGNLRSIINRFNLEQYNGSQCEEVRQIFAELNSEDTKPEVVLQ